MIGAHWTVRRLAAVDMHGVAGTRRRRRIVCAEFGLGTAGLVALAVILLGHEAWPWAIWALGCGANYAALAVYAISLYPGGRLAAELEGVDVRSEIRRYTAAQLLLFIPALIAIVAGAQSLRARHQAITASAVSSLIVLPSPAGDREIGELLPVARDGSRGGDSPSAVAERVESDALVAAAPGERRDRWRRVTDCDVGHVGTGVVACHGVWHETYAAVRGDEREQLLDARRLSSYPTRQTVMSLFGQPAGRRRLAGYHGVDDECLVSKVGECNPLRACESMPGRERDEARLAGDDLELELALSREKASERDVDVAAGDVVQVVEG